MTAVRTRVNLLLPNLLRQVQRKRRVIESIVKNVAAYSMIEDWLNNYNRLFTLFALKNLHLNAAQYVVIVAVA